MPPHTSSTTMPESQPVPERSSRVYSAVLRDMTGMALDPEQVTSVKFSLRDDRTDEVINHRFRIEVLNQNGGTLLAGGVWALVLTPEDMQTTSRGKLQKRRMLFEVDYDGGHENHEVYFWVENLEDISFANLGTQEIVEMIEQLEAELV